MPLEQGQVLVNRYRIASLLGQGGFGAVYRAWDINLSRTCALKENLDTSDDARRQFEREAQILANLSHPGLPRVTDHFVIPGQGQYLVMDYIEGDDLQKMLDQAKGSLPEDKVLAWITQVCDALAYLHTHTPAVIHRDIKPANIKITPLSQAVLVDFGIAKLSAPGLRTTTGARAVTPGYSPPEQYGQGQTDAQSDIYALGATLYHLLTGVLPPDSVDLVTGNSRPLLPACEVNTRISRGVSVAIQRAMQPGRAARFHSVSEMRTALLTSSTPAGRPAADFPADAEGGDSTRPVAAQASTDDAHVSGRFARVQRAINQTTPPPSRPTTQPPANRAALLWLAAGGMVFLALLVLGILGVMWMASWMKSTPTPIAKNGQGDLQKITPAEQVSTPLPSSPTPVDDTPTLPVVKTASGIPLPQARLAFVSGHREDQKERIYIVDVAGGNYTQSEIMSGAPFGKPLALASDDRYDMAWWPDWCGGNQTIFFEMQDTQDPLFQAVGFVGTGTNSAPQEFTQMKGVAKLGVPRCSSKGQKLLVSALKDASSNDWELYSYDMVSQTTQRVGDGFSFAGYAAWSGDDSWVVFMHKGAADAGFRLIELTWKPFNYADLKMPTTLVSQKYPAISPTSGKIAFACSDTQQWGLCVMEHGQTNVQVLLSNLGALSGNRPAPKRPAPAITPNWSPDGNWLAYASAKDGDWDIYLYAPEFQVEYNLTQALTGDQFEPAWSKP